MDLASCVTTTILPVTDIDRARAFYEGPLGLRCRGEDPDGKLMFWGAAQLALIPKPPGAQAEHTALSFEVPDIETMIADLEKRGLTFEHYICRGSGRSTTSACSAPRRRPGSRTPTATSSACTSR